MEARVRYPHLHLIDWPFQPASLGFSRFMADRNLTRESLRCLDLTPHAQAVLEKLKSEAGNYSLEESRRRRQETELKSRLANLGKYLGTADAEREETYWRLIREARAQLKTIENKPPAPSTTLADVENVAEFLENLESNWERYPSRMRNRLLKLLIKCVELRHDSSHIEATIIWKMGFTQKININRPTAHFTKDKCWQPDEDNLLRILWPTATWETTVAALPGRTPESINQRASRLKIKRRWQREVPGRERHWTKEEEARLKKLYTGIKRTRDSRNAGAHWASYQRESLSTGGTPAGRLLSEEVPG